MSVREPSEQEFLTEISEHTMKTLLDSGIHRHLRFQKPSNSHLWFDIVTWPGVLTIHGDMGTWTFSRVEDMFTFFRSTNGKLEINPSYWAEKLRGGIHGGRDAAKVWEEESFKSRLLGQLTEYYSLTGKDLRVVTQALKDEVFNQDCKYDLLIAARDFTCPLPEKRGESKRTFQFDTCEMPDGREYAYHFLWCLYAIVWAIQQWDKAVTV